MIQTQNLTKEFGFLRAVDTLNLDIAPGEFFAFLGPNAAGKTTTIKMLAGLLKPSAGTARVAGFDIQQTRWRPSASSATCQIYPFSTTS